MPDFSRLTLGTAPDSWVSGSLTTHIRCRGNGSLDEKVRAGYTWNELGPPTAICLPTPASSVTS
jgi:hypothetical protein